MATRTPFAEPLVVASHGAEWTLNAVPDSHIGAIIAESGGPYEADMLDHIARQDFSGAAVDVGAHIGNHAIYFALVCGLRVYAFEPIFTPELRANVAANHLEDRIEVFDSALGDHAGRARDSGERVISDPEAVGDRTEGRIILGRGPLSVHPLDEWAPTAVALIKIDVEGMEPEVLRGAESTIRGQRPVIYAEAKSKHDHQEIRRVIEPWGYVRTERWGRLTPREEWRHKRTI